MEIVLSVGERVRLVGRAGLSVGRSPSWFRPKASGPSWLRWARRGKTAQYLALRAKIVLRRAEAW